VTQRRIGSVPYHAEKDEFDPHAFEPSEDLSRWTLGKDWKWVTVYVDIDKINKAQEQK